MVPKVDRLSHGVVREGVIEEAPERGVFGGALGSREIDDAVRQVEHLLPILKREPLVNAAVVTAHAPVKIEEGEGDFEPAVATDKTARKADPLSLPTGE